MTGVATNVVAKFWQEGERKENEIVDKQMMAKGLAMEKSFMPRKATSVKSSLLVEGVPADLEIMEADMVKSSVATKVSSQGVEVDGRANAIRR